MKRIYFLLIATMICSLGFSQSLSIVKDTREGDVLSAPSQLTANSKMLIYYNYDGTVYNTYKDFDQQDLWVSDGSAENTFLKELNTITTEETYTSSTTGESKDYTKYYSSYVSDGFVFKDKIYFSGIESSTSGDYNVYTLDDVNSDPVKVKEGSWTPLWISDDLIYYRDETDGPIMSWDGVNDPIELGNQRVNNGTDDVVVVTPRNHIFPFGDKFLIHGSYVTEPDAENEVKRQLFVLDPAGTEGPELVKVLSDGNNSTMQVMKQYGDKVYFIANNDSRDYCIWVTDGVAGGAGTMEIAKIRAELGTTGNTGYEFAIYNDMFYFSGDDNTNEKQLYRYNPVADELVRLTSLTKVDDTSSPIDFSPSDFVELDGILYFTANYAFLKESSSEPGTYYSTTTSALYKLNESGEPEVIEESLPLAGVGSLTILDGKIYFIAEDTEFIENEDGSFTSSGDELFVYEPGTATSIYPAFEQKSFSVSPNPSYGSVNVSGLESASATYELYNLAGSKLEGGVISNGVINYSVGAGMYLLRIVDGSTSSVTKIIVK